MKEAIINYLKINGNVKRRSLLAYLRNTGHSITDRELRQTIVSMIEDDGHLIMSSAKGYKLATTVKEYEGAIRFTESYIFSLLRKRKALKRNFNRLSATLFA